MAETMLTAIQRRLRSGYQVVGLGKQEYGILSPGGKVLKDDGHVIAFKDTSVPSGRLFDNLISQLRRAGAIQPRRKASHERREARHVKTSDPKNSVIIAQETLRDPTASPRERALARNYLALIESQQRLRKLTRALGARLKEIEDLQD